MRTFYLIFLSLIFTTSVALAQNTEKSENKKKSEPVAKKDGDKKDEGQKFVDLDGDGFNDNAPDHDGDGIPNGLDPDWEGQQKNKFVDMDGDGLNDNQMQFRHGKNNVMSGSDPGSQQPKGSPQVQKGEQTRKGNKGKK